MNRALAVPGVAVLLALLPVPPLLTFPAVAAQKKPNRDPDAARFVVSDIDLFWKAYDRSKPEDRTQVLREEYLDKGSPGLKAFTRARIRSAENLAATIARHPKYYATLRASSHKVADFRDAMRASFRKLKELYEPAVFPDVYFLIGSMNSGGTITDTGLLIGVDMYGLAKGAPADELGPWHKAVVKPVEEIPYIVAHELIHYQQKYPRPNATLLGMAVSEGSADFVGELISGSLINLHLHRYGNPRERELWAEFKKQMDGKDLSNWLFQGDRAKGRPADLGYYVGYKICEAYYRRTADKKAVVKAILEITDFKEFLRASKYESKFAAEPPGKESPALTAAPPATTTDQSKSRSPASTEKSLAPAATVPQARAPLCHPRDSLPGYVDYAARPGLKEKPKPPY